MTTANVSRRSVTKGAAWGVPALTVAAAAPAMAASAAPSVLGASYFFDDYQVGVFSTTITGEIRPLQTEGACSYNVSNGPATVANVSATYWVPISNYKFAATNANGWSVPTLDSSKGTKVGPNTGLTYYPYTTTYTGSSTSACGPTYSFKAPAVTTTIKNPNASYFYQLTYTLNGTTKTNPLRTINNP